MAPLDGSPLDFETQAVPVDEVGQVLMRAAQVIRENGHAKGCARDERGGRCTVGALSSVADYALVCEGISRLEKMLGLRNDGSALVNWNDAPERTASEVITVLEEAARSRIVQP